MALTQPRAFGAFSGQPYGAFTSKARRLTQPRAFGAMTGRRYGSFEGKQEAPPPGTETAGRKRVWYTRQVEQRRFLEAQRALDRARDEEIAAKAALEALTREKGSENAFAAALARLRETTAALQRAEIATEIDGQRALPAFERALSAFERALPAFEPPEIGARPAVIDEEIAPRLSNRRRAAILAALLLLDD